MCEFSGKLIAWLDGELASDEAAGVERHVPACAGCRSAIESYKRVSCEFSAYCEHALEASSTDSRMPRWIPAASAAGAVAAFLVLFLAWPRAATERPGPRVPQQVAVATSATFDTRGHSAGIHCSDPRYSPSAFRRDARANCEAICESRRSTGSQPEYLFRDGRSRDPNRHPRRRNVSAGSGAGRDPLCRGPDDCARWYGRKPSFAPASRGI